MRQLILGFILVAAQIVSAEIVRGPYIQMPDNDGVTIVWRTKDDVVSRVDYGLTRDCTRNVTAPGEPTRKHAVRLAGLQPGTNYFYRVEDKVFSLRTRRTPNQAVRFAVIGDFGTGNEDENRIAQLVNARTIDLLLTVGDNVYSKGERKDYAPKWFTRYAPTMSRVACFPTLGNHDIKTENGQPFVDYFWLPSNGPAGLTERNYSFDFGPVHFVAIDSNPFHDKQTDVMKQITEWVKADLARTKQPWNIAYFHHPGYTSVGGHDETPLVKSELMPVLEAGDVQMVFCGHNHFYERIKPINGVVEIITGGGGGSLYKIKQRRPYSVTSLTDRHSFTIVDINGPTLSLRQIDDTGGTVDTFSLSLPPARPSR